MADFESGFYTHPILKQPVRFYIGKDYNPYEVLVNGIHVTYQMEIWNIDRTELINKKPSEQKRTYLNNQEEKEAWKNTTLQSLIDAGFTAYGEATTAGIFKAILDRQGITEDDLIDG